MFPPRRALGSPQSSGLRRIASRAPAARRSARMRHAPFMNLLAIDTSTDFCSIAASRGESLFSRHEPAGQRQAEMILGMVDAVLAEEGAGERIISCLDAHMGEVYHAAYRRAGARWEEVSAPGLYKPEAVPVAPGAGWTGCGDGFAAYRERLAARLGGCVSAVRSGTGPTARAVLRLALTRFAAGEAMDAAGAVPVYLRDKVALKTSERE